MRSSATMKILFATGVTLLTISGARHSSGYEWLVVTGDDTAQYKGVGTVNGAVAPNGTLYHFMVWAGDGEPDTFRIRIWWEDSGQETELYDSETTILGGGSIVIH